MKFLLLMVMLTVCAASPQDLSGKMFTFPQQSNTARVQLNTTREKFYAATVCLRFITDLKRDHVLFSLATPSADNSFMIFRYAARDAINVFVLDISAAFTGQDYMLNMWHSICSTWDSRSCLAQLWFDGQSWTRKYVSPGSHISGHAIIFLGQDQDSHGGGFEINKSFVGMISDVHMWDYTLSPCEIREYMDEHNFTPGNILNWSALEFQITDRVLIEDTPKAMYC